MIKKTITYDDFNDNEVTEDFYFNLTKLEMMELEIAFEGGINGQIERISKSEDAREAYQLFKDIVLKAYGLKSDDGKRFVKNDAIRREFEESPAMSELILGFLADAKSGAEFVEGMLPAKLVAQVKSANENVDSALLEPDASEPTEEKPEEISDEDLLVMDPSKMTKAQLVRAMRLKSQR